MLPRILGTPLLPPPNPPAPTIPGRSPPPPPPPPHVRIPCAPLAPPPSRLALQAQVIAWSVHLVFKRAIPLETCPPELFTALLAAYARGGPRRIINYHLLWPTISALLAGSSPLNSAMLLCIVTIYSNDR